MSALFWSLYLLNTIHSEKTEGSVSEAENLAHGKTQKPEFLLRCMIEIRRNITYMGETLGEYTGLPSDRNTPRENLLIQSTV